MSEGLSVFERVKLWRPLDLLFSAIERAAKVIVAVGIVGGTIATIVIFIRGHKVGAWVPIVVAVPLVLVIGLAYVLGRREPSAVETTTDEPTARESELEQAVRTAEYEKRLLWDVLESIQQAIASEENWQLNELVERGVLGPARGFLTREREEDVRLSVLVPRDDDPNCFRMRWAEGHRPESVKHYNREIDKTMAGLAYRRGEFVESSDVREDDRFEPNPKESRPFRSLVSMPLRIDEKIVGAFTVVSTRPSAFGPTDVAFIKLIGAVLDVLVASEFDGNRWEEYAKAQRAGSTDEPPHSKKADPDGA
jgi:GAF domain